MVQRKRCHCAAVVTASAFVFFGRALATDLVEDNTVVLDDPMDEDDTAGEDGLTGGPEEENHTQSLPDPEEAGHHDGPFDARFAKKFAQWLPDDTIEIYYGEFLLAQWVLDHAPWNAYHSAVGFNNTRTNEKALFSYSPVNTSSVMNMVMPHIQIGSLWKALIFGAEAIEHKDQARLEFFPNWPEDYSKFDRLGNASGTMFHKFTDWAIDVFIPRHGAFQPIEVADLNRAVAANRPNNKEHEMTVVRSRMCHDFVTDALWFFFEAGATLKPDGNIFRDHIIMYADAVEETGPINDLRRKRRFLRYWRLIGLFLEGIRKEFTYARAALVAGWRLGLPVFLHDQWQEYEIHLAPPFLNYCYLPLAIPPERHNPFAAVKLCALGMEVNATNTSAPSPWGPLLAVEDRLDQPMPVLGFAVVVLAALAFASA